jgi:hypothetical protein
MNSTVTPGILPWIRISTSADPENLIVGELNDDDGPPAGNKEPKVSFARSVDIVNKCITPDNDGVTFLA